MTQRRVGAWCKVFVAIAGLAVLMGCGGTEQGTPGSAAGADLGTPADSAVDARRAEEVATDSGGGGDASSAPPDGGVAPDLAPADAPGDVDARCGPDGEPCRDGLVCNAIPFREVCVAPRSLVSGVRCASEAVCEDGLACRAQPGGGFCGRPGGNAAGEPCIAGCAPELGCDGDGRCAPLVGEGASCTADDECAAGLGCNALLDIPVCARLGGGAEGSRCSGDVFCAPPLLCELGYCRAPGSRGPGEPCETSPLCAVGLACNPSYDPAECHGGERGARCEVTPCAAALACLPDAAGVYRCGTPRTVGEACSSSDECGGGLVCWPEGYPDGSCQPDGPPPRDGEPCTPSGGCAEGFVCNRVEGGAEPSPCRAFRSLEEGALCSHDDLCAAGLRCLGGFCRVARSVAVGGACASDLECAEGLGCTGSGYEWTCAAPGSLALGAKCGRPEFCEPGLVCKKGSCALGATGEPCEEDEECAPDLRCEPGPPPVAPGTCTPRLGLGAACVSARDCSEGLICHCPTSGACGSWSCMTPGDVGAPCRDARHCVGGLGCNGGTCGPYGLGEDSARCGQDAFCGPGLRCNTGLARPVCERAGEAAEGHACPSGVDGAEWCAAELVCRPTVDGPFRCASLGGAGSPCTEEGDCAGGLCFGWPSGPHVCRSGDEGDPCRDGTCRDGLVCSRATVLRRTASDEGSAQDGAEWWLCARPGAEGAPCGRDEDCAEDLACGARATRPGFGRCAPAGSGGPGAPCIGGGLCGAGLVCRTSAFDAAVRVCLPPAEDGSWCREDADCAEDRVCNGGEAGADNPALGACRPPAAAGAPCGERADCARGLLCVAAEEDAARGCTAFWACRPTRGHCAAEGSGDEGAPCWIAERRAVGETSDALCGAGLVCRGGLAWPACGPAAELLDPCLTGAECAPGLACEWSWSNGSRCVEASGSNGACHTQAGCADGLVCLADHTQWPPLSWCATPRTEWQSCSQDGDCATGLRCFRDQCRAPGGEDGPCRRREGGQEDATGCDAGLVCVDERCGHRSGRGGPCRTEDGCAEGLRCDGDLGVCY